MRHRRGEPLLFPRLMFAAALAGCVTAGPAVVRPAGSPGAATAEGAASVADVGEVLAAETALEEAVLTGNTAYWDSAVADDMLFVHETRWATGGRPTTDDKASFRTRLVEKVYALRDLDPVVRSVELHGDVAITDGRYVSMRRPLAGAPGTLSSIWFQRVWAKRGGRWIFLSHRTVHGPSPAPAGVDRTLAAPESEVWHVSDPAPPPPPPRSADEAEIRNIDQTFAGFVTRGDVQSAKNGTAADFVMVHGDEWTRGVKPRLVDTQKRMLRRVADRHYDVMDFDHVQTEMHGDVAITTGRYVAHTRGIRGRDAGSAWCAVWFERVYQKRGGHWVYLSHRSVRGPSCGASRQAVRSK